MLSTTSFVLQNPCRNVGMLTLRWPLYKVSNTKLVTLTFNKTIVRYIISVLKYTFISQYKANGGLWDILAERFIINQGVDVTSVLQNWISVHLCFFLQFSQLTRKFDSKLDLKFFSRLDFGSAGSRIFLWDQLRVSYRHMHFTLTVIYGINLALNKWMIKKRFRLKINS